MHNMLVRILHSSLNLWNNTKDKFKRQEHRTFIDWFITVPAKITRNGHQTKIKMYSLSRVSEKIIFTKTLGKSLIFRQAQYNTGLSKRHKKQRKSVCSRQGGKYEN